MKSKLIITSLCMILAGGSYVFANEGVDSKGAMEHIYHYTDHQDDSTAKTVEVGNKICPVSGDRISTLGENGTMSGKPVKFEYKGKIHNLCCEMCIKDFKKDPKKYSKIADEETKEIQVDPHRDHNHNNSQ